jgi:hypothetical protein
VDTIICHVVRKIGKGKLNDDKTALLNRILRQNESGKIPKNRKHLPYNNY